MLANRALIVGESGSGKTYYAAEMLGRYQGEGKANYVACFSRDEPEETPLAKRCETKIELNDALAARAATFDFYGLFNAYPSIYFEVTAVDPHKFIGGVVAALMEMRYAVVLFDEAAEYVNRKADPRTLAGYTRGRKRGLNIITLVTSIKQRDQLGLNPVAINRTNVYVSFLVDDKAEKAHMQTIYKRFKDFDTLRTPHSGAKPEYAVRHADTGRERFINQTSEMAL